jgi:hypothetical protein
LTGVVVCSLLVSAACADASWSAPASFSPSGESVDAPDVAANATGGAAVAWSRQIDAYTSSVEVVVRQDGGVFSAPQTISLPSTGLNVDPSVAVGADGTVAVVWSQEDSTAVVSFGSVTGGTFSQPAALESAPDADGPKAPYVAIDSAGDVFAAWTDQINVATDGGTDANTVIHYTSRPAGSTRFGPVATLTSPSGQMFYPTFASAPSGATVATWSDAYAAARPAGGQFGPAEHLATGCVISGPDPAAIDSAGDAVVAWDSTPDCDSGAPVTVLASYMPAGGSFGAAETVAQMGGWSGATSAVMSQSGQPTIALAGTLQSPTDNEGLTTLTRSSQGSWGSPQTLFDTEGAANAPLSDDLVDGATLAYDSSGDLYAAWNAQAWNSDETADSGIYAEIQSAGGSFDGSPAQVEHTDGVLDSAPVLADAGTGTALLGWTTGGIGHYADFTATDSGSGSEGTSGSGSGSGSGGTRSGGGADSTDGGGSSDNSTGGAAEGSGDSSASAGEESSVGENPVVPTTATSAAAPAAASTTPQPSGHATRASPPHAQTIIIRGRARAESVLVKLIAGRRVIAHRRVDARRGHYTAVLRIPGTFTRRLRLQITVITAHGRTTRSRLIRT